MPKEKPILVNTIYALTGKIVKSEVLQRIVIQNSVCINGVMHHVKNLSNCGVGYLVEIIDDIPEWQEFLKPTMIDGELKGGLLYPVKPIEEVDPEFHRLLSWYCTERKEILKTLKLRYIMIDANKDEILAIPIETREQHCYA